MTWARDGAARLLEWLLDDMGDDSQIGDGLAHGRRQLLRSVVACLRAQP